MWGLMRRNWFGDSSVRRALSCQESRTICIRVEQCVRGGEARLNHDLGLMYKSLTTKPLGGAQREGGGVR